MISEEKQDYLCPESASCDTLVRWLSLSVILIRMSNPALSSLIFSSFWEHKHYNFGLQKCSPIQRHALHLHFFSSLHVTPAVSVVRCDFLTFSDQKFASTCTCTWNPKHLDTLLLWTNEKKVNTLSLLLLLTSAMITKQLCSCCFLSSPASFVSLSLTGDQCAIMLPSL